MDWIYIHPSVIIVSNLKWTDFLWVVVSLGSGLNSTLQNVYLKNGVKRSNLVFDPTKKQPPCNSAAAKVCNLDAKVDHI